MLLELKAVRALDSSHKAQLINALKATDLEVGLLLNFGPRPEFKRVVYSNSTPTHKKRREWMGTGSATICSIRVIRGELHALSPALTPHPPSGYRLGEATRMTRIQRMTADRLMVVRSPPQRQHGVAQIHVTSRLGESWVGIREDPPNPRDPR